MLVPPVRAARAATALALLWLTLPAGAPAAPRIERIGQEEGPMPDVVTALCLDRSGLLWIGTFGGGLSALDPASGAITTWWSRPSDPATNSDDRVDSLFEDQSGILWVGTHADAVLEMTGTVTGTP